MKIYKPGVTAIIFSILAASCGGGGNSESDSTADRSLAQGVYADKIVYADKTEYESLHFIQQTVVLENGEIYIVYGNYYDSFFYVDGFLHGTGQISSDKTEFQASDLNDYFYRNKAVDAVYTGTLKAQFSPGVYFNGTADQSDSVINFTGNASPNISYDYNSRAEPKNIAGTWDMKDLLADPLTLNISIDGTLTGTYLDGCSLSGRLNPRYTGKNIFDATFTFGGYPCSQPNRTFSGIAINHMATIQHGSLIIAGITADRRHGMAFFNSK